jgi:hypothetical protein
MSTGEERDRLQLVLDDETYDALSRAAGIRRISTEQLMADLLDVACTRVDELLGPRDRKEPEQKRHPPLGGA